MSFAASRLLIKDDGSVVFPGIDYEGRRPTVHERSGDVLVIHITGGSGWGGVGMRSYSPAQFEVVRLKGKPKKRSRYMNEVGEEWAFEHLATFDIKKQRAAGRSRDGR